MDSVDKIIRGMKVIAAALIAGISVSVLFGWASVQTSVLSSYGFGASFVMPWWMPVLVFGGVTGAGFFLGGLLEKKDADANRDFVRDFERDNF